jgi:hypothetical protein
MQRVLIFVDAADPMFGANNAAIMGGYILYPTTYQFQASELIEFEGA